MWMFLFFFKKADNAHSKLLAYRSFSTSEQYKTATRFPTGRRFAFSSTRIRIPRIRQYRANF